MTYPAPLYIALVHHPIVNKYGEVVTTSITTFDIHDSARIGRTFGVKTVFLVSPIEEQQGLVSYFKNYWTEGCGGQRHASRRDALERIEGAVSLAKTLERIKECEGDSPLVVATSAREIATLPNWTMATLATEWQKQRKPLLLLFGTGWGLAEEVFTSCQAILEPILGADTYNHLPVRAAIAIYLHELCNAAHR